MAKSLATPDLARTYRGEIVFSNIQTRSGFKRFWILRFDNQIEMPVPLTENQFGLFKFPGVEDLLPMFTRHQFHFYSAGKDIESYTIPLERRSSLIKMDPGSIKSYDRNRMVFLYFLQCFLSLVSFANRVNGFTTHLRPQRRGRSQVEIGQPVKCHTVPAPIFNDNWHQFDYRHPRREREAF